MPPPSPAPSRESRLLKRLRTSESFLLSASAVAVGLLAAGGVYGFKRWIEAVEAGVRAVLHGVPVGLGTVAAVAVPALGGLLVGWILARFVGPERHHGVAGIMESVALAGGRLRWRRMPVKALSAGLSIGVGASVGPEDPSVQIGSNVGSFFGQRLRLSDDRTRALVAAGAAAGIAAAFDAPIAGVFFAVEILLGEIAASALGVVLLAAVCSSALTHVLVGEHPAFQVPAYALHGVAELPAYLGLGALAGIVAGAYVTALYAAHDLYRVTRLPAWLRPATAGLAVGLLALVLPQIQGVGYGTLERVLQGTGPAVGLLLALLAAKLAMTALCIGAGFPGGVFAPALYLGAMLGGAVGVGVSRVAPGLGVEPAAFALVGMGAVLAGAVHAPLTAILLLFEMTHDYRIMVPAMLAVTVSLAVSRRVRRESVYTLALARKGIRLERGRDVEVLDGITVGEVMQTAVPTLPEHATAQAALEAISRTRHLGLAVTSPEGDLVGIVAAQDLDRAASEGRLEDRTVGDVCTRDVLVAWPDETLGAALRRMSVRDVGRLPVVHRDAPRRIVGMLRRSDVVRAYDLALGRRATLRHRVQQVRLGATNDAAVVEVEVEAGSPCDGRRVAEIAWPRDCVVASVRRGGRLLLPRGDTRLEVGDVLLAVTDGDAAAGVRGLCAGAGRPPP